MLGSGSIIWTYFSDVRFWPTALNDISLNNLFKPGHNHSHYQFSIQVIFNSIIWNGDFPSDHERISWTNVHTQFLKMNFIAWSGAPILQYIWEMLSWFRIITIEGMFIVETLSSWSTLVIHNKFCYDRFYFEIRSRKCRHKL